MAEAPVKKIEVSGFVFSDTDGDRKVSGGDKIILPCGKETTVAEFVGRIEDKGLRGLFNDTIDYEKKRSFIAQFQRFAGEATKVAGLIEKAQEDAAKASRSMTLQEVLAKLKIYSSSVAGPYETLPRGEIWLTIKIGKDGKVLDIQIDEARTTIKYDGERGINSRLRNAMLGLMRLYGRHLVFPESEEVREISQHLSFSRAD